MGRYICAASALALCGALSTSAVSQTQVQIYYTYDVQGRMVAVARPASSTGYTYDNAGNRIRLTITANNRAPVANADSLTVTAGQATTIDPRANDTDADSDPLTVTGVSSAANNKGSTAYTASSVTYTANSGQSSGTDSFTYTISDGKGGTATATVNVTINATPAAPTVANTTASLIGNTTNNSLPLSISGGSPTSVAVSTAPANGTASVSNTAILYTPDAGWSGQTSLKYTASNSAGTSTSATVTINVAPVVSSVSGSATQNVQTTLALNPRTNYTSMSLTGGGPSYGSASISGSTVTYKANSNTAGSTDTFSYIATSAGGTSQAANISFSISAAATAAPTVSAVSASIPYNTATGFALAPSGTYSSLSTAGGPSHGSLSLSGTTATYTPTSGYYGSDSFTYTATGPGGTSAPATVSLTVSPPAAPTVAAVSASTAYNTAIAIALSPQGAYSSLAVATNPGHGAASISGTTATYTPTNGYSGSDSFTYTATGPGGTSAPASVSITVAAPAAPAIAVSLSSTSYTRVRTAGKWETVTPVTCSASGGTPAYSYSWEYVSGATGLTQNGTSVSNWIWSSATPADAEYIASWRCKVTDSLGAVGYSGNVALDIILSSGN